RRAAFEARREKKLALLDRLGKEKEARGAAIAEMEDAARALEGAFEALRAIAPPPPAALEAAPEGRDAGPRERFSALRGRVPMPVEGRIVKKFGLRADPTLGTRIHSNGITVRAPYGAPVLSVADGRVLYAGWFRGYGRILITDHGEGYYTLVAHASELRKQVGDRVRKGELIARVGDSGSLDGPKLYFEIRARGKPVDPMPWLGR
ncbi:MAG: murein hydrolase activator EnvC family protein, partial [Myxococcota bacterium]